MKGSIKKRGTKWSYIVDVGFDENGKRKQKTKSGFRTKAEAQAACNELINQINKGQYVEEKRMTLEEYLLLWLKDYAKPNMRQTSYDLREVLITKRIIPALGKYEIQKITPHQISKFYVELNEKGLSQEYNTVFIHFYALLLKER